MYFCVYFRGDFRAPERNKMRKKTLTLIVGLMTVALLGVMAMQYFFIRQSYIQQSQLFDESVNAAITTVASRAEKKEVLEYSQQVQQRTEQRAMRQQNLERQLRVQEELDQVRKQLIEIERTYKEHEEQMYRIYPHAVLLDNDFYETYIRVPQNNHLVSIDFGMQRQGIEGSFLQENYISVGATKELPTVPAQDDSARFLVMMDINPFTRSSSNNIVTLPPMTDERMKQKLQDLEREARLLQANSLLDTIAILGGKSTRMIEDFAITAELSQKPLDQRLDIEYIKRELQQELQNREIHSPFHLEIRSEDEVFYSFVQWDINEPMPKEGKFQSASYSTPLFKEDLAQSPGWLTVYFPDKQRTLLGNVNMMLSSSVALLLVLIGAFAFTLMTILRQKKMSEMKTDFINNMTHEFKTPVATIMIASETLKDPEISLDQKRVSRLANVIYDENVRLGNHIERVLNIAQLEKEEMRMSLQDVPINSMVQSVADSMQLQFQKAGAELELDLGADQDLILGDELHLANVFYNLLDNALKYSTETPIVRIRTMNVDQGVCITVSDNGIGMSKDHLSKIFDQFYRVPTGNRHDVKGFGLGLSYVADVVKRLKGKVSVNSEKGKGTVFEVWMPLKLT